MQFEKHVHKNNENRYSKKNPNYFHLLVYTICLTFIINVFFSPNYFQPFFIFIHLICFLSTPALLQLWTHLPSFSVKWLKWLYVAYIKLYYMNYYFSTILFVNLRELVISAQQ